MGRWGACAALALALGRPCFPATRLTSPPIGFEENKGQYPAGILYASRLGFYTKADALVFASYQIGLGFVGANSGIAVRPADMLPGQVNIVGGPSGIRQYRTVQFPNVYPGIDASFMADNPQVKIRLSLGPGASIATVVVVVTGEANLAVGWAGGQLYFFPGNVALSRPVAYQGATAVDAQYTLISPTRFGIVLGAYDQTQPLTVDMESNSLRDDLASAPSVAAPSGAFYQVSSVPELITGPRNGTCHPGVPCRDVAVMRFAPTGELTYITYLRGSGDQFAKRARVRQNFGSTLQPPGETLYVTGETSSPDFPVTANAAQKTYGGAADAGPDYYPVSGDVFVAALDGGTGSLLYSTFLGGPNVDTVWDLHVDGGTGVIVTGSYSAGLPATNTIAPVTACQYCAAKFAARIDMASGALRYLVYLPGEPWTADVDAAGNLYFSGTRSGSAFVAKLNASGTALEYQRDFGAGLIGKSIAADSHGNAWVALGDAPNANHYLAKLDATGSTLLYYSPFFEGDVAVDSANNVIFTSGSHASTSLDTPGGRLSTACGFDYLAKLDPTGTVLLERALQGTPLGFDNLNRLVVSTGDGIVALDLTAGPRRWAACLFNAAGFDRRDLVAPGEIVSLLGNGIGPAQGVSYQPGAQGRVPAVTGGTRVLFNGAAAPVLYAQDGQVNAIVPFGAVPGTTATIQVEYQGQALEPLTVAVTAAEPEIFALGGGPEAIAVNQDGTPNGESNPAAPGSIMAVFVNGLGATAPASVEGEIATSTAPAPTAKFTAYLLRPTEAIYAGPSPGSVTSVMQLNLRVPDLGNGTGVLRAALDVLPEGAAFIPRTVWVAVGSR